MGATQRREREREARRQAIVDAAQKVVFEKGFAATTMEDVAAEAELSKGALYLYFDNKDALCAAIAERCMNELLPRLETTLQDEAAAPVRLARTFNLYAQFFRQHPQLFRMALSWMLEGVQSDADSPALASYRQTVGHVLRLVTRVIEEGKANGTLREDVDPLTLAVQLWGGFLGVMLLDLNREDMARRMPYSLDMDRIVPLYVEGSLRAIQGPCTSEAELRAVMQSVASLDGGAS